ncbi:hypothetical protein NPIL_419611 [Nephila pilipes]|uniref:C2H2-type domain-containing protein n=1 Tax=Nephila pilipes TaxID=299642 RepID=A0A8X6UI23_NEPPI|nr:hypothetical protein NPIL_419611 [Nephila pilipes]
MANPCVHCNGMFSEFTQQPKHKLILHSGQTYRPATNKDEETWERFFNYFKFRISVDRCNLCGMNERMHMKEPKRMKILRAHPYILGTTSKLQLDTKRYTPAKLGGPLSINLKNTVKYSFLDFKRI